MTTLLLVEDDETLGTTLQERLGEEGYTVCWVKTNGDAEREFERLAVDLIILDIGLPDGSGFGFARHVKSAKDTPIVFLTAMNSAEYRLEGFEIGAEDYIPKPFHLRELLLRIDRVLSSRSIPKTIQFAGASLNPEAMTINFPDGEEEPLPLRDFELLKLLIASSPKVLSRNEIHEKLWGSESEGSTHRSIDNAILRLRAILRKISEEEFIRSVRGIGYQWVYGRGAAE